MIDVLEARLEGILENLVRPGRVSSEFLAGHLGILDAELSTDVEVILVDDLLDHECHPRGPPMNGTASCMALRLSDEPLALLRHDVIERNLFWRILRIFWLELFRIHRDIRDVVDEVPGDPRQFLLPSVSRKEHLHNLAIVLEDNLLATNEGPDEVDILLDLPLLDDGNSHLLEDLEVFSSNTSTVAAMLLFLVAHHEGLQPLVSLLLREVQ